MLDELGKDHGKPETLVADARKTVDKIKAFIRDKKILTLPDPDTCKVIEMPEFQRGFSAAYLNPAPPLDPKADSLYAVAPPPADWSPERVETFLREYNSAMLQILTIHEAYPGHYVQLAYSNRCPSLVRKVLWSGTFAEGWAVYTEQMMLDQGYGDGDLSLRLHQLKFYMRAVLNAILDNKMHCANMTDEEAMKMLVEPRVPDGGGGGGQDPAGEAEQHATLDVLRRPHRVLPAAAGRAAEAGRRVRPGQVPRGGAEPRHAAGEVPAGAGEVRAYCPGTSRSARTASSVSLAAVTPMRSKHSATMLLGVVNRVMSRSIGVTLVAAAVGGAVVGVAEQADDVVGEELAVEQQRRDRLAVPPGGTARGTGRAGRAGRPRGGGRPLGHAGVRRGRASPMNRCGRADAVPVGGAGVAERFPQHPGGGLVQDVRAEPAAGQKDVVHVSTRFRLGVD